MNSIDFLKDPDQWPNWPICPVVNRKLELGDRHRYGIVGNFADEPPGRIYFTNMWSLSKDFPNGVEVKDYGSWEAMLEDGWMVD